MAAGPSRFAISPEELGDLVQYKKLLEKYETSEKIADLLHTSLENGLLDDKSALEQRTEYFGENFISPRMPHNFFFYFFKAFQDPILIFLIIAAIVIFISEMVRNPKSGGLEGIAIIVAVLVIVSVTSINDYQKECQFKNLQKTIKLGNTCVAIRGGEPVEVATKYLVVGDIYLPKYGDQIPADAIVFHSNDLRIDESSMTGESDLVKKDPLTGPYLLSGTHVMEGSGKAIIVAVGIHSQSGRIVRLLGVTKKNRKEKDPPPIATTGGQPLLPPPLSITGSDSSHPPSSHPSPPASKPPDSSQKSRSILQEKLTKLALLIGKFGIAAGVLVFCVLLIRYCVHTYTGEDKQPFTPSQLINIVDFLVVGFTIVVVAVPEGLPLAVTLALAYSVTRMLKEHNLVRQLYSCETMGNATTICSDKTGTLTTNRMTVVEYYCLEKHQTQISAPIQLPQLVNETMCMNICLNKSSASIIEAPKFQGALPTQLGNKTDCALLGFLPSLSTELSQWQSRFPEKCVIKIFPFNSKKKLMSVLVDIGSNRLRVLVKGAFEVILQNCKYQFTEAGTLEELSYTKLQSINTVIRSMTNSALRVILLAYKDVQRSSVINLETVEESTLLREDLILITAMGIEDPVRPEVPEAIKLCTKAGVVVRMVTGDNIITARSIAIKCGIIRENDTDCLVLDSDKFNEMINNKKGEIEQKLIDRVWPKLRVLARSSPQDKYNLVNGIINSHLSKDEEVVAVTGDGTNDAPALRRADVGFSMGVAGTDVAKEASDIVLTDDNFASIVRALLWGRNVYDAISKFIQFQVTVNVVAISTSVITSIYYGDNVLKPSQLLWVNLLMDSMASLALATDSPTPDLLDRPPYGRKRGLISSNMIHFITFHSIFQITVLLVLIFLAPSLFDVDNGFLLDEYAKKANIEPPDTQHLTMVFNTFVFLQFFNQINARKVHNERNVFQNIHLNKIFMGVMTLTLVIQILIIRFTYKFFHVVPLTLEQWLWCVFLGFSELVYHQLVISLPRIKVPKKYRHIEGISNASVLEHDQAFSPRLVWIRGISRLRQQIRVVQAFKSGIQPNFCQHYGGASSPSSDDKPKVENSGSFGDAGKIRKSVSATDLLQVVCEEHYASAPHSLSHEHPHISIVP